MVIWGCSKEKRSPIEDSLANDPDFKMIWNKGEHNAFTDLIQNDGKLYCVFREASSHISHDGFYRVLISADGGTSWQAQFELRADGLDLRDPKFFVDKKGSLSLAGYGRNQEDSCFNLLWKLGKNGVSGPFRTWSKDYWLWRFTSFNQKNYVFGYKSSRTARPIPKLLLFRSTDSSYLQYEPQDSDSPTFRCPSESSMVITKDSIAYVSLRDDCSGGSFIGRSEYPFTNWNWEKLKHPVRGPNMILLPNGNLALAAGSMIEYNKSYLAIINPNTLEVNSIEELPSGGDTGYPGLVLKGSTLYITYYSYFKGKTAIFFKKHKL